MQKIYGERNGHGFLGYTGIVLRKDALKQLGWLDQARKPKVLGEGLHVAFPVTEEAALYLQDVGSKDMPSAVCRKLTQEVFQGLISKLVATGGEVAEMHLAYDAHRPISPSHTGDGCV